MRCKSIKPLMHDLLDKTISPGEAREVEDHLAVCENCRNEFKKLKRADDILREVVCEMVSEIEVPPDLGRRIENILAAERKKKTLAGRLPLLLKTPEVAAALLLLVVAAGIFSFYNHFSPSVKEPQVVLSEPQGGTADRADQLFILKDSTSSDELRDPTIKEQPAAENTGRSPGAGLSKRQAFPEPAQSARANETHTVKEKSPAGDTGGEVKVDSRESSADVMTSQTSPGLGGGPPLSPEKRSYNAAADISAAGAPVLKKGTLEEAAKEVGFTPARPAYLPRGAELQEVAWRPGVVHQNYRAGQTAFTITQSLAYAAMSVNDDPERQGKPVEINGARAILREAGSEADNLDRGYTSVRWQRGEWVFSVGGELPGEEIIKIASSLK